MSCRSIRPARTLGAWIFVLACAPLCSAGEPYLDFLRGLQRHKYGEQALAYLDQIADRPDVPADLKRTLDLERSKCLRLAAAEAYDKPQREARLAEAKRLAEKFFTENPNHPAAGAALLGEADELFDRGVASLGESRGAREKEVQEKLLAAARAALTQARAQYDTAVKKLKERIDQLPPEPDKPGRRASAREELEFSWLDARFKSSLATYLLAQTWSDPKAKERIDLLKTAGKGFDAMFQEYRTTDKRIAMPPHMWHGKTLEDLGDKTTAMDVYDEVLVLAPDTGDAKNLDLAPLFGQAELFRMRMLIASEEAEPKDVVAEAETWLGNHKKWQAAGPFQGIALEAAKAKLALAEKARSPAEKTKIFREAILALAAIGKVETEYRHEAMLLRREAIEKTGASGGTTFEDRLALGEEAIGERNWAGAESLLREAVDQAVKAKDAKKIEASQQRLALVLFERAKGFYAAGEMDKVLAAANEIVRDNAEQEVAENASALAVAATLQIYSSAAAADRPAALAHLEKVAQYAIGRWPDKPVGDDARMSLAQAYLIGGDFPPALELLAKVSSQSKRYPTALQILGQIRWKQYIDGKKAADAADKAAELKKLRDEAVQSLATSVGKQRASVQPADPMPAALFDTQMLLAETYLEGQDPKKAAELLAPLVAEINRAKPTSIDSKSQRVFVRAVQSQLAAGDAAAAGAAALTLAQLSSDAPQPNGLLVDLAKLMAMEIRKVEASQGDESAGNGATIVAANPATAKLREVFGQLLDVIAPHKQLNVQQLIFLGDSCVQLGKSAKAREIYTQLLDSIDKDPAAKATAGAAVTRIRARLVGILRGEGKLEEANKQVDALLKANPNALEPLMEKGYILEALAEKTPSRADECIAHWTDLRLRLGRAKERPPEYYEVLYNTARCLVRQSRQTSNKEKALQAEQILKSTLILSPSLSGPDMVARYQALLTAAISLRGGKSPPPAPGPPK